MTKRFDITRWSKILILLISAILLLSACSKESSRPFTRTEAEAAAAAMKGDCWQKEVLTVVYDTIGMTVMGMYNSLSAGAVNLMMMGFAVWLALRLLKFIGSVTEDSPSEVWNEILKKAFLCALCGFLASSSSMLLYTINILLFPIYEAFLEFGSQILALSTSDITSVKVFGEEIVFKEPNVICKLGKDGLQATLESFPGGIKDMMGCMICGVAERLELGRQVAAITMTSGGIMPFLVGLLIWFIFIVVACAFVFYLVDSVFRFGMMILLLPIFIMSFAFGPTKKWTGIGFSNIMNSAAFMMAFSIIIATVLMAMVTLINDNPFIFSPSDDPDLNSMHLQDFSITMMCLLLIGFLIFGSMGVSQQLTSAIIGGKSDAKFQQNLKAVGQMVLGWITGGASWAITKAGFKDRTAVGRVFKNAGAMRNQLNKYAGRK